MNLTDAAASQADFDAVMDGSASDEQCAGVIQIATELAAALQEARLRAMALPERRDAFYALLSDDRRDRLVSIVGGRTKAEQDAVDAAAAKAAADAAMDTVPSSVNPQPIVTGRLP